MTKQKYDIHLNTPATGIIKAAECILLETDGILTDFGFRYTSEYLDYSGAFPLDPQTLPLRAAPVELTCHLGIPGLIDDYLPDAWGRKVLSQLAFYRDHHKLNAHSCIDTLSLLGSSRIGALQIIETQDTPKFTLGANITELETAEKIAQQIDSSDYSELTPDELSLIYLANNGSGIGGARPKAMIHDDSMTYIAKFNRLTQDNYNNARIEKTCLDMAKIIGITNINSKIRKAINGREVLLVERFDTNPDKSRNHLISINSLLKQSSTQRDFAGAFRYNDIHEVIQKYSGAITNDLLQLLKTMLFNRMINNTDDHERNFSLIFNGQHYQLAPAYDMVPSLQRGGYHAAGFDQKPSPPRLSEAGKLGKIFGLSKTQVADCVEQVMSVGKQWHKFAEANDMSEEEIEKVYSVFNF